MKNDLVFEIKKIMVNLSLYTAGLIIGPLVVFGAAGYLLDIYFQSKPVFLIISVVIAVVFSNIFIFKKVLELNRTIKKQTEKLRQDNKQNET